MADDAPRCPPVHGRLHRSDSGATVDTPRPLRLRAAPHLREPSLPEQAGRVGRRPGLRVAQKPLLYPQKAWSTPVVECGRPQMDQGARVVVAVLDLDQVVGVVGSPSTVVRVPDRRPEIGLRTEQNRTVGIVEVACATDRRLRRQQVEGTVAIHIDPETLGVPVAIAIAVAVGVGRAGKHQLSHSRQASWVRFRLSAEPTRSMARTVSSRCWRGQLRGEPSRKPSISASTASASPTKGK
jgi:hypothetical protein